MASFPLQDQPLVLPSGRTVRIYNLLFLTQTEDPSAFLRVEPSFRIQYSSVIAQDDWAERAVEAAEVIAYFLGEASAEQLAVAYADICSTPSQAEGRESPETSFVFRRGGDGAWRLADSGNRVLDDPPNER